MKKIKLTSLLVAFLAYSALLVDTAFNLGRDTEYNRLLWGTINTTFGSSEPRPRLTVQERREMYLTMRRDRAFKEVGDYALETPVKGRRDLAAARGTQGPSKQ